MNISLLSDWLCIICELQYVSFSNGSLLCASIELAHFKFFKRIFRFLGALLLDSLIIGTSERAELQTEYPFEEFKVSKFDTSTQKRAIAKPDILKFVDDSQPIGQKRYVQLSKDIFMFSYLCGGINFTDIANLTRANIVNGRLEYIRQKTHKLIKIGIPDEAMRIIKKYEAESTGYLFPILNNKVHKTALQKQNRIHKMRGKVNYNLKVLGKRLGIEISVTTYVARHSFASVLKKSGVNIAIISEALGHSDLATTQIYLDNFDNEQMDDAMKNLL